MIGSRVMSRRVGQRLLRLLEKDRRMSQAEGHGEVRHERKRARDPGTHEAVYSPSQGGSQGVGEEHDRSPLPQGERRGGYARTTPPPTSVSRAT